MCTTRRSRIARVDPQGTAEAHWVYATRLLKGLGSVVVLGDEMEQLAVELKERAEDPVAQPHRVSNDGIEDRLHIGRRAADYPQNLGGRCLTATSMFQLSL
jgi:hypothetical protein